MLRQTADETGTWHTEGLPIDPFHGRPIRLAYGTRTVAGGVRGFYRGPGRSLPAGQGPFGDKAKLFVERKTGRGGIELDARHAAALQVLESPA